MSLYRIYDRYNRTLWRSLMFLPVILALACVAYYLTGQGRYALITAFVLFGLLVVRTILVFTYLECPKCGKRAMHLISDTQIILAYGIRHYFVECRHCGASFETDMKRKEGVSFSYNIRREEVDSPEETAPMYEHERFTKGDVLLGLFLGVFPALLFLAYICLRFG